jgi:hypothetical protein
MIDKQNLAETSSQLLRNRDAQIKIRLIET